MATIEIGNENGRLGTVSVESDAAPFQYTGDIGQLKGLIKSIQRSPLYRNLSNLDLLQMLPQVLDNYVWAKPVDDKGEPLNGQ